MHTYRKSSLLASFFDLLFDLFLCFFNHFLDTGRMDRPSLISFSRATRATSRRTGSKPEIITASGVSSMIRSIPVKVSSVRIFLPSRPIMRFHFIIRQGYYRNSSFCYVVGRTTLNRQRNDLSGLLSASSFACCSKSLMSIAVSCFTSSSTD